MEERVAKALGFEEYPSSGKVHECIRTVVEKCTPEMTEEEITETVETLPFMLRRELQRSAALEEDSDSSSSSDDLNLSSSSDEELSGGYNPAESLKSILYSANVSNTLNKIERDAVENLMSPDAEHLQRAALALEKERHLEEEALQNEWHEMHKESLESLAALKSMRETRKQFESIRQAAQQNVNAFVSSKMDKIQANMVRKAQEANEILASLTALRR